MFTVKNAMFRALSLVFSLTALACGARAFAHEGPPFPVFVDRPIAGQLVSLWADPDIGDARFFVILESPDGGIPSQLPQVLFWTEPTSGRLQRKYDPALRLPQRNRAQFEATPYFDRQDFWNVGVTLTMANGEQQQVVTRIESTPPGLGPWDLAIYLFPFLLIGGMWTAALIRRRRDTRCRAAGNAVAAQREPSSRDGEFCLGRNPE